MTSPLQLALRNKLVISWLESLNHPESLMGKLVAREYAFHMHFPAEEVMGALSELRDQPDLDWVWERYQEVIKQFSGSEWATLLP